MKTTTIILLVFLTSIGLWAQTPPTPRPAPQRPGRVPANPANPPPARPTLPSLPVPAPSATPTTPAAATPASTAKSEQVVPAGDINFQGVDVDQVLDVYAKYVGRTLLRAGLPSTKIILKTETPLTRGEVIQALQGVLALNGIALINIGTKFVKAVPVAQAAKTGQKFNAETAAQLPDLGQYVTHIVQLKYIKPTELAPILQQFATQANAVFPIDSNGILILRDYAENVKRMLEFIKQVDVNQPEEFVSEVIPIKYALASDIANALNSLGTGGGSVTIGSRSGGVGTSGGRTSIGGSTRFGNNSPYGSTMGNTMGYRPMALGDPTPLSRNLNQENATYTPMAVGNPVPGNTFSQRLRNIINRASSGGSGGSQKIEILGPTKIIADERSNSLLVFASRQDMKTITNIVAKLDVLLPQVLIQSVILDVSLNSGWNFGVSAAQNPKNFSGGTPPNTYSGAGGYNNGQSFFDFAANQLGSNSASAFIGNSLGSGLSYFGNLGPTWDVAIQAAANDNNVTIVQRPSVQTSQAKAASFFVGQSVPYPENTYYGTSVYGGGTSYGYLQVGIGLQVTPFINPNGLVVMDIQQQISDLAPGSASVSSGVAPTTDSRTLNSEVAVKSGDTIMLGGYITTSSSRSRKGVPLLEDIPLLGSLFSNHSKSKQRTELVVLMHPVVLNSPDEAAAQVNKEIQTLPGITRAISEDRLNEQAQMEKVQKEIRRERAKAGYERGSFEGSSTVPPTSTANALYQPLPEASGETNRTAYPNY